MNKMVGLTFLVVIFTFSTSYAIEHKGSNHSDHIGHGHDIVAESIVEGTDLGICPVMGGKAVKDYSVQHNGKTVYFCCPSCIGEFEKNPNKYISKYKEFDLEAYQFGFSPEVIEVQKGDIVRINLKSRDVSHGIYIRELDVNAGVKKGQVRKVGFVADKKGSFDILCSVYCGKGHHSMKAKLIVSE